MLGIAMTAAIGAGLMYAGDKMSDKNRKENLQNQTVTAREDIADFAAIKTQMFVFFIILAAGVGIYVKDFLAVRAHAVFMFLVAKLIYDTARYADSGWAILFPALATVLVFFGMWFTVSPWRLRDMLQGLINRDKLWKSFWFGRMLLGILLVFLGVAGIR